MVLSLTIAFLLSIMSKIRFHFLPKGRLQKKNRKIWGFCPKRREGVISETQFLHAFNLGHLSEEGGDQNLNSQICMPILLIKFYSKWCPFFNPSLTFFQCSFNIIHIYIHLHVISMWSTFFRASLSQNLNYLPWMKMNIQPWR